MKKQSRKEYKLSEMQEGDRFMFFPYSKQNTVYQFVSKKTTEFIYKTTGISSKEKGTRIDKPVIFIRNIHEN